MIATFHVTRYDRIRDGMPHMYFDRALLRGADGLRFWRLLGTPDPRQWAMFAVWEDEAALDGFGGPIPDRWASAPEHREWRLRPVRWHGEWGGVDPFAGAEPVEAEGPLAVFTRASVRLRSTREFRRATPDVPGGILAGEWPIARQATFSVWESVEALQAFRRGHADVIRRTRERGWYSEELFARFAISSATR